MSAEIRAEFTVRFSWDIVLLERMPQLPRKTRR